MQKEILRTQEEVDDFLEKIADSRPQYLALDIETDWFSDEKFSPLHLWLDWIGLYDWVNMWFIIHNDTINYEGLDVIIHNIPLITQNGKFDITVLLNLGYITDLDELTIHDTKILSFLCDENKPSHSLKELAKTILWKEDVVKLDDVGKKPIMEKNLLTMNKEGQDVFKKDELTPWEEKLWSYCIDDCVNTFELFHYFQKNIPTPRIWAVYEKIELPILKLLIEMEITGINVDKNYLAQIEDKIQDKILELQIKIYQEAWTDFNIGSAKQIQEIFLKLEIDIPEKYRTPKGWISTWVGALKFLEEEGYKIAGLILKWREFNKLDTWFIKALSEKTIHWKIHCNFNQIGTVSWRFSSSNVNLMNIPSRSDEFDIRKAFVAKEGYSFIISDLSQAELRILAHYTQEEVLLNAFTNLEDIHQATADKLNIDRNTAKTVSFWILYGMSSYWLAGTLGITRVKADEIIKNYFSELPAVKKFIDSCYNTVEQHKFITTILWRHRNFPKYGVRTQYPAHSTEEQKKAIRMQDFKDKSHMERQIVNSCIQGSAADYIKLAMRNITKKITEYNATILITVHDEVIIECPDKDLEVVGNIVKFEMENAIKLKWVPVEASLQISKFWCK